MTVVQPVIDSAILLLLIQKHNCTVSNCTAALMCNSLFVTDLNHTYTAVTFSTKTVVLESCDFRDDFYILQLLVVGNNTVYFTS